jgi:transcriptional regulator with XRE-family HTH domain
MMLGVRLKEIREHKNLSQGDVEKVSGLKRCYISRVENGHTVPAVETLEKLARALDIPIYRLFYDGDRLSLPQRPKQERSSSWGNSGRSRRYLDRLAFALGKLTPNDRDLILLMAHRVRRRQRRSLS